jgi:hypothetical protein
MENEMSEEVESPFSWLEGMSLRELASRMKNLGEQHDELKSEAAKVYNEWDFIRKNLIPATMEREGVTRVTYDGIGRVQLAADMYVKTEDKHALAVWLKDHDAADLIQPTINGSTLKSFLKKEIVAGREIPDADVVLVTPFTRASIVKG